MTNGSDLVYFLTTKFEKRINEIAILDKNTKLESENYFYEILDSFDNSEKKYSLLQYDLKPSNLMYTDSGLKVVDFDKASWGETEMDLAKFFWRTAKFDEKILSNVTSNLKMKVSTQKIKFYLFLHCIGALAFYETLNNKKKKSYQKHIIEANIFVNTVIKG